MLTINNNFNYNTSFQKSIKPFRFYNKDLGLLTLTSKVDMFKPTWITTVIENSLGKVLGKELLALNPVTKQGEGHLLYVINEYKQKNFRFGELLRLSSIVDIIENEISQFEIFSKDSAVYFHSKYKFIPAITDPKERDKALQSVVKNCRNLEEFKEFKKQAADILKISSINPSEETQAVLCREANVLLKNYIAKVMEEKDRYKSHGFESGFSMILRRSKIIRNKDFFNDLFAKHNIDYRI